MKSIFALLRLPLALAALLTALGAPTAWAHTYMWQDDATVHLRSVRLSGMSRVSVSGPGIDGSRAAVACTTRPSTWAAPVATSRWVGSMADCGSLPAGDFTYSTTFALPADLSPLRDLRLNGMVAADDTVTVQLNGHTVFSGGFWTTATEFATTERSWFTPGTNTLAFVVRNNGAASGIDFGAALSATTTMPILQLIDDDDDDDDHDQQANHGACVSLVAHGDDHGQNHGALVSAAAKSCGH